MKEIEARIVRRAGRCTPVLCRPRKRRPGAGYIRHRRLNADHEGISIYKLTDTTGYILVSDQGANRFQIFSREGTKANPFEHKLLKIANVAARQSDGSDITATPLNGTFKHGIFVVMSTDKTFHYYR
ncbi:MULTISPECIES: phytase [Mucilaginibacter]|uniref:phytase n=1 Tax=Mucilaginibacter TaxID=423349 RepID=UPI001FB6FAA4|nr:MULTISPECIES: phytase [Mucilaginibacter]